MRVYLCNVCWSLSSLCGDLSDVREVKAINSVCSFVCKILGHHKNLVAIFICRGPLKSYELGMLPLPFPFGGLILQWTYMSYFQGRGGVSLGCCVYVVWGRKHGRVHNSITMHRLK